MILVKEYGISSSLQYLTHSEKMVLNQTHSERIVRNLESVKQVRGKWESFPLVNLFNFGFRTTVAGGYNTTVGAFFFPPFLS